MQNKETIIQKNYNLLKCSIPIINKFPRTYKFTLGDRLQNQLSELLEIYINAYYLPKSQKQELLSKANINLEITRHYYRLAFELGLYSSTKYKDFALKINEIGKMTGGWIKSL